MKLPSWTKAALCAIKRKHPESRIEGITTDFEGNETRYNRRCNRCGRTRFAKPRKVSNG